MRHKVIGAILATAMVVACDDDTSPVPSETTQVTTTPRDQGPRSEPDLAPDSSPEADRGREEEDMPPALEGPVVFTCQPGASSCPEILIEGDPIDHDCLEVMGQPTLPDCPIRGHFDPSLERDPDTGTLWLTYSSTTLFFAGMPSPANVLGAINTELARSDDGGASWQWVATINRTRAHSDPEAGAGALMHEVSTLTRAADGDWVLHWVQFVRITGGAPYQRPVIMEKRASSPPALAQAEAQAHMGAIASSTEFPADFALHELFAPLERCAGPTEPGLFFEGGRQRSIVECIGVDVASQDADPRLNTVELLSRTAQGYSYDGRVLTPQDAQALVQVEPALGEVEAVILTQPAVVAGREPGTWFLLVAPAVHYRGAGKVRHGGCLALAFEDIATGRLRRDGNGVPEVVAELRAPFDGHLGPGLCDYDADSETGIVMVLMSETLRDNGETDRMRLTLHATGVHL